MQKRKGETEAQRSEVTWQISCYTEFITMVSIIQPCVLTHPAFLTCYSFLEV